MPSSELHVFISRADPHEGERLREIAIASKGHWGYEPERVREWAAGCDFSPQTLRTTDIYVADAGGQLVGWAGVVPKGDIWSLDDLWVEPEWIGKGIGARLFRHAGDRSEERRVGKECRGRLSAE